MSTMRSPAGPPRGPASPSPRSGMKFPLVTPGGTFTEMVSLSDIRPSPAHVLQRSRTMRPSP